MPKFAYSAIDPTGATVEGTIKGETVGAARSLLMKKELHPVSLKEKTGGLSVEITQAKLKKIQLMHFSRQMSVFIKAGIPIIDSLETIGEEAQDKVLRKVIFDMAERLRQGSTFADAAAAHPEAFPPYYLGILRSAELTGNLDSTLDQLADYLDRDIEARRKIISTLMYPVIVVLMSFGTVGIMAFYVLPQFADFFDEFDTELPLATRMLLGITNFMVDYWWAILLFVLLILLFNVFLNTVESGKQLRDRMVLKIPIIGEIVQFSILERFTRILSSMVTAGVALPDALKVTIEATNNRVYMAGLETARQAMIEGAGFSGPLAETGLFPGAARQMFKVGEETGTLDEQLRTASLFLDRELDMRIKRFTTLIEPAVLLFVGGMVGFVAIALVSALYGLLGGVKESDPSGGSA
jgi:type IV pilus assembly protein PilC